MIRLLIADDHPIVREGLRRIVAEQPGMTVVGEATTGDEVLAEVRRHVVDVLLLDISMPGLGFLEVLRQLKEEHPRLRVLVLSTHPEEQYAVRALKAGAAGYLTKDPARRLGEGRTPRIRPRARAPPRLSGWRRAWRAAPPPADGGWPHEFGR